jgi:hypothetical protein
MEDKKICVRCGKDATHEWLRLPSGEYLCFGCITEEEGDQFLKEADELVMANLDKKRFTVLYTQDDDDTWPVNLSEDFDTRESALEFIEAGKQDPYQYGFELIDNYFGEI